MGEVNGVGLAAVAAGSIFVYGGITGKSPLAALQAVIRGDSPATAAKTAPITVHNVNPDNPRQTTDFSSGPGSGGGGSVSGQSAAGVAGEVITWAAGHGFNKAATAGILGNMLWESGLDPTRPNPGEGAIGLCQWEGGRRTRLQHRAAKMGLPETATAAQLAYLWEELTTTEAATYLALKGAQTPEGAAANFDILFERSDGSAREKRKEFAREWYAKLGGS